MAEALNPKVLVVAHPGQGVARDLCAAVEAAGFACELVDVADVDVADLAASTPAAYLGAPGPGALAAPDSTPDALVADASSLKPRELRKLISGSRRRNPALPVIIAGRRDRTTSVGAVATHPGPRNVTPPQQLGETLRDVLAMAAAASREKPGAELETTAPRAAEILGENHKLIIIGRMAASIAHEINNPLESITNLLYLAQLDPELPASTRNYIDLAQQEMQRVVRISKQTLNFNRESGAPLSVQIEDLMEEVLVLYGRRIKEKRIRIERQFRPSDPVLLYPGEFRQVLSNLITNAIEACDEGGCIVLRVRNGRQWADSGVRGVRISVADNGSGIPEVSRRRLGQPFFTTKGQRGTGLGLWVTRSIIDRFGGQLRLKSSVGARHGTVFSILLPTNLRPRVVASRDPDDNRAAEGNPSSTGTGVAAPAGELAFLPRASGE